MATDKQLFSIFGAESGDFSVEKLFAFYYGKLPNVYSINFSTELKTILKRLNSKYNLSDENYLIKLEQGCKDQLLKVDYDKSAYLIKIADELLAFVSAGKADIYYSNDIDFSLIKELIQKFKTKRSNKVSTKHFYLLRPESADYSLKSIEVKDFDIDLNLLYNDDFIDFHKRVTDFINDKNTPGIILLHGKNGTGKTSYLKYLFHTLNKKFIVIQKRDFAHLASTNFYFFISEFNDAVLVLDDCDNMLSFTNKTSALTEFLNNASGLISTNYVYKIICTASVGIHHINQKLFSKAPLVLRYEMKELPKDKANKLRSKLGIKSGVTKPVTLAEALYPQLEKAPDKKLGFNS